MDKNALVAGLRELAEVLQPFIHEIRPGRQTFDGTRYVPTLEYRDGDCHALVWRSILRETADLLEAQDTPLSAAQVEHIRRNLFGGMGSFNDYSLNPDRSGPEAKVANERLNAKRSKLFELFAQPSSI